MIRNSKTGRCCSCTDNLYKEGILEMTKVFIDGSYGTTGLRIHQRLQSRTDLELISIPYEERHSESARRRAYEEADFVFMCLPDAAAI